MSTLRPPRVSVVIPAHNTESYVAAAVRSALAAGEPDIEVLVVDDGSTDGTVAAVRAIGDARVTVIEAPGSGRPSRPRNIGLAHVRAPYVAMLDSDDLMKPGNLPASVAALDACPSAGLAFGDYEKMDPDGNVFETSFVYAYPVFRGLAWQPAGDSWQLIPQRELARGLLYENFIGTSGVVMRIELVRRLGGFCEELTNGDDLDMWFRLAHCCDALYLPRVGFSYRIRAGSVVRGPRIRVALSSIKVMEREKARWQERAPRRQLDRRIAEFRAAIAYQQRQQRQRWSAVRSYFRAYAASPQRRWLAASVKAALFSPEPAGATRE